MPKTIAQRDVAASVVRSSFDEERAPSDSDSIELGLSFSSLRIIAPHDAAVASAFQLGKAHECRAWVARESYQKRQGSRYRGGRSADWVKVKNPVAPAVRRLQEEDWA